MRRLLFILTLVLLVPAGAHAAPASFWAARSVLIASSSPGNAFAAGASTVVTAPVAGDLVVLGGSVLTAAPVKGDELFLAGSIYSRERVEGDVRAAGGSILVEGPVGGDLAVLGFSVRTASRLAGSVFIAGANVGVGAGAAGPVTIYGNNVSLAGNFGGDVRVVSSGHITLAASTTIAGALSYEAPEEASIPASAVIRGGVTYTNASYLPDAGTSRILAIISIGLFLFVRILGALILAGLLAGLFPRLAESVVERAVSIRPSRFLLTILLGFAVVIVTPVLFLLLALTFVGIGLALLVIIAYAFLMLLSLAYAGILIGSLFARRYARRETVLWHDGVLGTLVLSVIALVPYVGLLVVCLLATFCTGALILIFFHFAFPHEADTSESA